MQQVELESERQYVHAAYTNDYEYLASTSCYLSSAPVSPPESLPLLRKDHVRKRSTKHIKRPPNAFFLYRSDFLKKGIIPPDVESKQQNISRVVGACWNRLSSAEQSIWRTLAKHKEMEHAMMYPNYRYKPEKRGQVKRRKNAFTKEQQEQHCDSLRVRYLPDKAGPAVHHAPPESPCKRKSRAKPPMNAPLPNESAAPLPPPPTLPSASFGECHSPAFMYPLMRPTSPPQQDLWRVQPYSQSWGKQNNFNGGAEEIVPLPWISQRKSHSYPEPEFDYDPGFDFYSLPPPPQEDFQDDLKVDLPEWSEAYAHSLQNTYTEPGEQQQYPPCTTSSTIALPPPPLQVAAHIREQYNTACLEGRVPTTMSDAREAQLIFEPQPFFISSRPIHPVEVQPHVDELVYITEAATYPFANSDPASFHHQPYPPSSPAPLSNSALFPPVSSSSPAPSPSLELTYPPKHSHTMDTHSFSPPLTGFPMTLHAAITPALSAESALHLQPPMFDLHAAARSELEALTLSLDTSSAALKGLEGQDFEEWGQEALFGGVAHLDGQGQWEEGIMEVLREEVCVRASR